MNSSNKGSDARTMVTSYSMGWVLTPRPPNEVERVGPRVGNDHAHNDTSAVLRILTEQRVTNDDAELHVFVNASTKA